MGNLLILFSQLRVPVPKKKGQTLEIGLSTGFILSVELRKASLCVSNHKAITFKVLLHSLLLFLLAHLIPTLYLAFMAPSQVHLHTRTLKNLVSVLRNYQIMLTSHAKQRWIL